MVRTSNRRPELAQRRHRDIVTSARTVRLVSLAMLSAAHLLSACSSGQDALPPGAVPTHDAETLEDLGVTGVLRDFDDCFYLDAGEPPSALALVFPSGYSRDGGSLLDSEGSEVASVGDFVEMGGTIRDESGQCDLPSDVRQTLLVSGVDAVEPEE